MGSRIYSDGGSGRVGIGLVRWYGWLAVMAVMAVLAGWRGEVSELNDLMSE